MNNCELIKLTNHLVSQGRLHLEVYVGYFLNHLFISDQISYQFSAINQNKISINFDYNEKNFSKEKYNYISGTKLQNKNKCFFEISNLNGKINLREFKKQKIILF